MPEVRFKREEILDASSRLRKWMEDNKKLPGFTYFRNKTMQIKDQDMLYLMSSAIVQIQYGQNEDVLYRNFSPATNPIDDIYAGRIPQPEYLKIAKDVRDYMERAGRAPDYALNTSLGEHLGFKNLVHMFSMVLDYNLDSAKLADWAEMTGKPQPVTKGKWWGEYEKEMKVSVKNILEVYNTLNKFGAQYNYYYEDVLPNQLVIDGLNQTDGETACKYPNCTDIAQVLYKIAREMGYNKYDPNNPNKSPSVRFVRGEVKCSDGKWYGHVFIEVIGGGLPEWTIVDGSAKLKKNAPMGALICSGGVRNKTYDPSWLLEAPDYFN